MLNSLEAQVIHKNAFTLIELLIVLWLISVLSLLITPPLLIQKQQFDVTQFFKVFESDIFLVQQKSIQGEPYRIMFQNNQYLITNSVDIIEKRPYPKNLTFKEYKEKIISYSVNGNVTKPATFYFDFSGEKITIVFPLGRGRFYFKE